jgi:hypothetical protein
MAAPTRDHIQPRSKGGTLAPHNKELACDPCNQDKGSRSLGSWLFRLQKADDRRAVLVAVFLAAVSAILLSGRPLQPGGFSFCLCQDRFDSALARAFGARPLPS